MGERWNEKLRKLREMLVGKARPIKVEPKRRWSGPTESPSDWYSVTGQQEVGRQCNLCHARPIAGSGELVKGLCGPCRQRLADQDDAA
jgi:mono/diheme cytochrome c family protein